MNTNPPFSEKAEIVKRIIKALENPENPRRVEAIARQRAEEDKMNQEVMPSAASAGSEQRWARLFYEQSTNPIS